MIINHHHTINREIHNVLIIQLGDIGDVVWTIPTFWAVKESYQHANISVLLREGFGCLLESDPVIYKIFEVKNNQGSLSYSTISQLRLIKELRREHFDLVFDLRGGDRGAIMARLTGAPIRASLLYQDVSFWRNSLFTHLLVEPAPPEKRILGAAEQSLRIIRGFGIDAIAAVPTLRISDRVMKTVHRLLTDSGIKHEVSDSSYRFITINPFSRWPYKEWAYDKWVSVINWLWNKFHVAVVIVGSKDEEARAAELVEKCAGAVYNLAGKTTLAELAGVLSLSQFHLGVDSAAPHVAAAVGTPTITIYGPTDWRDWAPVGDKHSIIVSDLDCVPCHKKGCNGLGQSKCLENLEANVVQKVIREEFEKILW
ncbi:MAG TPA: glycosyltransferase family 9 protein [Syntrophales bacterium]|nr:glycosyltransferase family 9 protein [Syntrophales bacterium]